MSQTPLIDYYKVLGISFTATPKEINSAYKRLALKCHPDKATDSDVDEFQKIQEAAETLRDPYRRHKHDYDLRALRIRENYAQRTKQGQPEGDFYSKWMPYSVGSYGRATGGYRYMYSYGNSVHMSPNSKESREERERCKREKEIDEELRARSKRGGGGEGVEGKENSKGSPLPNMKEPGRKKGAGTGAFPGAGAFADVWNSFGFEEMTWEKRQEGMRTRVERDEQVIGDHYSTGKEDTKERTRAPDVFEEPDEKPAAYDAASCKQNMGEHEESPEGEYDEGHHEDLPSDEQSTEYDTAQEDDGKGDGLHSDGKDDATPSIATHKPGAAPADDDAALFYDCAENDQSQSQYHPLNNYRNNNNIDIASASSEDEEESVESETGVETEDDEQEDNKNSSIFTPFISSFKAKLDDPSGKYTLNDLHAESRGMIMETYCGWLEGVRLGFSDADTATTTTSTNTTTTASTAHDDNAQDPCLHLGFWQKEYDTAECEVCGLWKPLFRLTCPGCGVRACAACKFQQVQVGF